MQIRLRHQMHWQQRYKTTENVLLGVSHGDIFFLEYARTVYHCIKMKNKLVQCFITTQTERTPDEHKPVNQLNTTRKNKLQYELLTSHTT